MLTYLIRKANGSLAATTDDPFTAAVVAIGLTAADGEDSAVEIGLLTLDVHLPGNKMPKAGLHDSVLRVAKQLWAMRCLSTEKGVARVADATVAREAEPEVT